MITEEQEQLISMLTKGTEHRKLYWEPVRYMSRRTYRFRTRLSDIDGTYTIEIEKGTETKHCINLDSVTIYIEDKRLCKELDKLAESIQLILDNKYRLQQFDKQMNVMLALQRSVGERSD